MPRFKIGAGLGGSVIFFLAPVIPATLREKRGHDDDGSEGVAIFATTFFDEFEVGFGHFFGNLGAENYLVDFS